MPSGAQSVTPSPLPPPRASIQNHPPAAAFPACPTNEENHPPVIANGNGPRHLRGNRNSNWRQEKQSQWAFQQSAFRKNAENPFSDFSYDPNDMESSLSVSAKKSTSPMPHDDSASVLPAHTYSAMKHASATKATPRSFKASGPYGTSGRKTGNTRGRRTRMFPKMADRDLLCMKAMEQEAYEAESTGTMYHAQPRQQYNSNMISQHDEQLVPEANFPACHAYASTYEPSVSIFPPRHSMSGGHHSFAGNSLYTEPVHTWGNNDGTVIQSQPAFSQFEATSQMNYGQPYSDGRGFYAHLSSAFEPLSQQNQGYHKANTWSQADSLENMQQQGPQPMMPACAFGAPPMTYHAYPGSDFMSQPQMDDPRTYYEEAVSAEDNEEDALFSAAFG